MQKKYAKWIDFLYGPFFRVIGFFYRIYAANRARIERIKQHKGFATFLKAVAVLVLLGWILIFVFASEEDRNRLTEEVKQTIGGFESGTTK